MPFKNTILSRIGPEAISRLHLTPVKFEVGYEIEYPGTPIERLFFVEEGMASMTVTYLDGAQVEVGMFGYESVIGVSALMGTRRSLNRVYTQVQGYGYSTTLREAHTEFDRRQEFQILALRYVQAQLVQCMQSSACNARHNVEQRLARWLLTTADRVHSNSFHLSQEFMAHMLGIARPAVSRAASILKDETLIDYTRGAVDILDRPGLERRSCECYEVIRNHLANFYEFEGQNLR